MAKVETLWCSMSELKASFTKSSPVKAQDLPKKPGFHIDSRVQALLEREDRAKADADARFEAEVDRRVQEIAQKAQKEGYEAGYQAGQATAQQEQLAWVTERNAEVKPTLEWLGLMRSRILDQEWEVLYKAILSLVSKLTLQEYQANPELLKKLFLDLVYEVGTNEIIKVHVHPRHIEALTSLKSELKVHFDQLRLYTVQPDDALRESDIIIETDWQKLKVDLETRIESLWNQRNPEKI